MAITAASFLYSHDATTGVATILLNRPQRMNALTFEVYTELLETFTALDTEPDVGAIVISGQGRPSAPAATCARSSARYCNAIRRHCTSSPA